MRLIWSRQHIWRKGERFEVMVGRARKVGRRERNGRIQRTYENPRAQVASQPHRMAVRVEYREFPEAESEFGRLMLRGLISPAQHEAGKRYADCVTAMRRVLDIPSPFPRACSLLGSYGPGMDIPANIAARIREAYEAAVCACGDAGNRAQRTVNACAVYEKRLEAGALDLLRTGLDKLVAHFGIDARLQISERQK